MSDKMREDAIREAACNVAVDEHFEARPHLMRTRHEERLFEAGFDRAWQAARTVPDELRKDAEKWRDLCSRVGADPSGIISYAGPLEGAPEDWAAIAQEVE